MVSAELDHMARLPRSPAALAELHGTTYVGLRGGWLDTPWKRGILQIGARIVQCGWEARRHAVTCVV
jgi:hypothetical protein